MTVTNAIAQYDWVELLEPIEDAPAGARGGLVDFLDGGYALVDVMEPRLDDMPVVCAPVSKLRSLGPERPPARS
ncbi:MAG TPA: hypothetical protein VK506_16025 [Conexibacter sp.]|nr:hypothetical protein [Conexibacter sp.]